MSNLISMSGVFFQWILQTTWQAAALAGLILLAQRLLGKRLSPAWRYGLWLLLVARLLMPVTPPSAFSIFNLARTAPPHRVTSNPPPMAFANNVNGKTAEVPAVAGQGEEPAPVQSPMAARPDWKINWFDAALCGWLAGVCFFGARLVWTNGRFRARIGAYQPVADGKVTQLFKECCAVFNITRPVRLIESEMVESPAVYGIWRKWLLLPDGTFERFSPEELRCIFLHELAHLKRGDLGVNWLVAGLQTLHWFNPVLWLAWARMRADREMATDALALLHVRGSDHTPYGETILKVLEGLAGERALPELVGIVENKARLKERLEAISQPGKHWKWAALIATTIIACIGLTCAKSNKDITGAWQASDVAFAPWTFNLKADGDKVTGTVSQGQNEGASYGNMMTLLTEPTAIYDGAISGNNVSFKCDVSGGGRTISFSGVMTGDTIAFTRSVKVQPGADPGMDGIYGASGATNFTAQRVVNSTAETAPPTSAQADNGAMAESGER